MATIFSTSGENSDNIVVPAPQLQGLFIPGMDNSQFIDGFGIVTPWGGGTTARRYGDYGISTEISNQSTQLNDLASSFIPAEGDGITYSFEGLKGDKGDPGRDGRDGVITIMGLNLPQNSNFLTALPHNIDQINDLGTQQDTLIYTSGYNTYIEELTWTERQPAGDVNKDWYGVASDSDGSHLIVAAENGRLYTSADSGATWTERRPDGDRNGNWKLASDSDGSHLIVAEQGKRLYTSADSGVNWTERQPAGVGDKNWYSVASDSDGSHLVATTRDTTNHLYTSADYGVSWTGRDTGVTNGQYCVAASDADGSHLIVCFYGTRLYTSSDYGVNWTERRPEGDVNTDWQAVASDADGSHLMAAIENGRLYTSDDYGATWTERRPDGDTDKSWYTVASDSNGSHLIAGVDDGRLYTSNDFGVTWIEIQPAGASDLYWDAVASDSDGSNLIVGAYGGRLYTGAGSVLYSEATWAEAALTSAGRVLLDDADSAAQATTLGLGTGDSPTWTGATLSGLTASSLIATDGDKALESVTIGNSLSYSDSTLDTIQDIRTTATPEFNQVTLGVDPTNVSHSVTKSYADALVAGAFWTDVDVGTTENVDLSNGLEAGDIIDDYTLVEGDRVLVKEQTDQTENGLYVVPASGAASRADDANTAAEIENKKCIPLNGTTTKHRLYFCISGDIELGVTDIKFAEVTQVSAHNTLSGIQGGQADQYYHFTNAEHTALAKIPALTYASDSFIKVTAENTYAIRTLAEVKEDLDLEIGTDVQAYHANLASVAGLTYAAAAFVKMTGANTFALRTIGDTAEDLEATIDHDNLANGGAHDYAYISGNDGGTDITAAELEELSDGSETTLHSHAGAAAFGRPIILTPQCGIAPATSFATLDTIAGGSTPAETIPVLDFDADSSEYMDFKFALPAGYAGNGLDVTIIFSMTSDHDEGTPHKVRWEVAFAAISDDNVDINGDQAYDFNGASATVPSEVGEVSYDHILFTDGVDMDSLAAGNMAILRIYRDHDHADDNATGDAELQMISIKENV